MKNNFIKRQCVLGIVTKKDISKTLHWMIRLSIEPDGNVVFLEKDNWNKINVGDLLIIEYVIKEYPTFSKYKEAVKIFRYASNPEKIL